jgi:hypothetical protein
MSEQRIIQRWEWEARYRDGVGTQTLPVALGFFHHPVVKSAGLSATLAQDAAVIRTIEAIGNARFGTMSYPYLVTEAGRVFAGLTPGSIGAHTGGYNSRSTAISFVGNYEINRPSQKMIDAAIWLVRELERTGVVSGSALWRGHYEVAPTACPGKYLKPYLPDIVAAAREPVTVPEPEEEVDVLDCYEITAVCMNPDALAGFQRKCAELGLAGPVVITVVDKTAYVAKTHARAYPGANKAELLQTYCKDDPGIISFKGIPTTSGTHIALGVVEVGHMPRPLSPCPETPVEPPDAWRITEQTPSKIVLEG